MVINTPVSPLSKTEQSRHQPAAQDAIAGPAAQASETTVAISETIAAFTSRIGYEDLPAGLREFGRLHALDVVGVALAATQTKFARSAYTGLVPFSEAGRNTVIGMQDKFALRDAVLLNGILAHGLEYDDTHTAAQVHPSATAFPCALGMSEFLDKSGRELITAYLLGAEITSRLGLAANNTLHFQGFHPTGVFGHFGCAIIAAKLYGLNARETMMAQGLVGCTSSALGEYRSDGSWNKSVHGGWAGVGGITAASLARGGYVGSRKIYEGRDGLFRSHCGIRFNEIDLALITDGLGSVWHIQDAAIKPLPACHLLHACADSALILRREHRLNPEDIIEAQVLLHPQVFSLLCEPVEYRRQPQTEAAAQTSAQFVVAACLERGRLGFSELNAQALKDERILAMAQRVTYGAYHESLYPKHLSGGVIIKTRDGRTLSHREPVNRGSGDRALSADDIIAKFMENAEMTITRGQAEHIRDSVLDCERLKAREITLALCAGGNNPHVVHPPK